MKIFNVKNNWYTIVHNAISNITVREIYYNKNKFTIHFNFNSKNDVFINVLNSSLKFMSSKELVYFNINNPSNIIAFKKLIKNYEDCK